MKLNVLLAKTDHLQGTFKAMIKDYFSFFTKNQGAFLGEKKTYQSNDGQLDEPNRRGVKLIQTTVDEKIEWFEKQASDYIDSVFALEKTNSSGNAKSELIVDGNSWGELSTSELLRLKSILEDNNLLSMYNSIPTRSDAEVWVESNEDTYLGKSVFASPKQEYVNKTSVKESYILKDPNVSESTKNYTPQVASKVTIVELGNGSNQKFSGQWSHRQRAELLQRRNVLLSAVIETLKKANEVEMIKSELTANKLFKYLHG